MELVTFCLVKSFSLYIRRTIYLFCTSYMLLYFSFKIGMHIAAYILCTHASCCMLLKCIKYYFFDFTVYIGFTLLLDPQRELYENFISSPYTLWNVSHLEFFFSKRDYIKNKLSVQKHFFHSTDIRVFRINNTYTVRNTKRYNILTVYICVRIQNAEAEDNKKTKYKRFV